MSGTVRSAPGDFELVVMVGSLGAIALYPELFGQLAPLEIPLVLVQHRPPGEDRLAEIIDGRCALRVRGLRGETVLRDGVYVAPPDRQVTLSARYRAVLAEVDGSRPRCAANPLFASAAEAHRGRVLAVVLSGRLDDGAAGARTVRRAGGRVIVQEPPAGPGGGMPRSALATGCVDLCVPADRIGSAIVALTSAPGASELFGSRTSSWALGSNVAASERGV